jgi:hypothetical protein
MNMGKTIGIVGPLANHHMLFVKERRSDERHFISVLTMVPRPHETEITNFRVWPQGKFDLRFKNTE